MNSRWYPCLWCENPTKATRFLPALTSKWRRRSEWIDAMSRDLASCRECVFAYHAAREADADSDYGHRLFDYDVDRLISSLDYDEDDVAIEERLHTILTELLSYPEYLLDDDVARLFEQAFEEYEETNDEELEADENFAGLYLLVVHPSYKIRRWALKSVRDRGIVDMIRFDELEFSFKIVFSCIDCASNVRLSSPDLFPPKHLFGKAYDVWIGIAMLLVSMDIQTLRIRFLADDGFRRVVSRIFDVLRSDAVLFWPIFRCLVILLERARNRVWTLAPTVRPEVVFDIVTTHESYVHELERMSSSSTTNEESRLSAVSLAVSDDEALTNSQIAYTWTGQSSSRTDGRSRFHAATFNWFLPFLVSLSDETDRRVASQVFPLLVGFLVDAPKRYGGGGGGTSSPLYIKSRSILLQLIVYCVSEEAYDVIESSSRTWISFLVDCALLKRQDTWSDNSSLPAHDFPPIATRARNTISLLLRQGDVASTAARRYEELIRPRFDKHSKDTCYEVYCMTKQEHKLLCEYLVRTVSKQAANLSPQRFNDDEDVETIPEAVEESDDENVEIIDLTVVSSPELFPDERTVKKQEPEEEEDDFSRVVGRHRGGRKRAALIIISDSSSSSEDELVLFHPPIRGRKRGKKKNVFRDDDDDEEDLWTPAAPLRKDALAVEPSSRGGKRKVEPSSPARHVSTPSYNKKAQKLETVVQKLAEKKKPEKKEDAWISTRVTRRTFNEAQGGASSRADESKLSSRVSDRKASGKGATSLAKSGDDEEQGTMSTSNKKATVSKSSALLKRSRKLLVPSIPVLQKVISAPSSSEEVLQPPRTCVSVPHFYKESSTAKVEQPSETGTREEKAVETEADSLEEEAESLLTKPPVLESTPRADDRRKMPSRGQSPPVSEIKPPNPLRPPSPLPSPEPLQPPKPPDLLFLENDFDDHIWDDWDWDDVDKRNKEEEDERRAKMRLGRPGPPTRIEIIEPPRLSKKSRRPNLVSSRVSTTAKAVAHQRLPIETKPSRPPDKNRMLFNVLSWRPDDAIAPPKLTQSAAPALDRYRTVDKFLTTFETFILLEVWEDVVRGKKEMAKIATKKKTTTTTITKPEFEGRVRNVHWISNTGIINIRCEQRISFKNDVESRHVFDGDLVQLSINRLGIPQVFAKVDSVTKNRYGGETLLVVVFQLKRPFHSPQENDSVHAQYVTTLTPAERRYEGLVSAHHNILIRDILSPEYGKTFVIGDPAKPLTFKDLSVQPVKSFNSSQEKAIASVVLSCLRTSFREPKICLLQGPPGTGKTRTVVGLVEAFLREGSRALPSESSRLPQPKKHRILLCAPSNAGIDEVVLRMMQAGIVEHVSDAESSFASSPAASSSSSSSAKFKVVRIGRLSAIHPLVKAVALENLVSRELSGAVLTEMDESVDVAKIINDIEAVDKELASIQRHHDSANLQRTNDRIESLRGRRVRLEETRKKASQISRQKSRLHNKVYKDILLNADVVCATLSGSGQHKVANLLKEKRGNGAIPHFSCVIIDEAAQCSEVDILIPLQYGTSKLILVGDPAQLPATVLSQKSEDMNLGRSFFERCQSLFEVLESRANPVKMLTMQYRMHPEICHFPSKQFYGGKLLSHRTDFSESWSFRPYLLFDVSSGKEKSAGAGSIFNDVEALFVAHLCTVLRKKLTEASIGIITPYNEQKKVLRATLASRGLRAIEVGTVDSFQGREKDVIILSCVRAQNRTGGIGFLARKQRLNVALTRAKKSLYVAGNLDTLKVDATWNSLIEDGYSRGVVVPAINLSWAAERCLTLTPFVPSGQQQHVQSTATVAIPASKPRGVAAASSRPPPLPPPPPLASIYHPPPPAPSKNVVPSQLDRRRPPPLMTLRLNTEYRPSHPMPTNTALLPTLAPPPPPPTRAPSSNEVVIPGRNRPRPAALPTSRRASHDDKVPSTHRDPQSVPRANIASAPGSSGGESTSSRGFGGSTVRVAHAGSDTERLRRMALHGKCIRPYVVEDRAERRAKPLSRLQTLVKDMNKKRK